MIIFHILLLSVVAAVASRRQGPSRLFPRPEGELTKAEEARRDVLSFEKNIICYAYKICYLEERPRIRDYQLPFQTSIVSNETESVEVYAAMFEIFEETYDDNFSQPPKPSGKPGSVGSLLSDIMGGFRNMISIVDKGADSSILAWQNASKTGRVFSEYFATDAELFDVEMKAETFLDGSRDSDFSTDRRQTEHVPSSNFYQSADLDEELDKIEEILSLILAYFMGGHSSNYRDVYQRIGELKKYGAAALARYSRTVEEAYGDILEEQREREGSYNEEIANALIDDMFTMEKKLRDQWRILIAKVDDSANVDDDSQRDEHIRSRLRYVRMFNSLEGLKEAKRRLAYVLEKTISAKVKPSEDIFLQKKQ